MTSNADYEKTGKKQETAIRGLRFVSAGRCWHAIGVSAAFPRGSAQGLLCRGKKALSDQAFVRQTHRGRAVLSQAEQCKSYKKHGLVGVCFFQYTTTIPVA